MKRLLTLVVATIISNAVALIAGSLILDDVSLGWQGFFVGLLIFTVVAVILEPIIRKLADDKAPAAVGLSSLVATLLSLLVTSLVGKSLQIRGALTWLLAAIIVWVISAALRFVIVKIIDADMDSAANRSRR